MTDKKSIGGREFTVRMLPPRKALHAAILVSSVFGGVLAEIMKMKDTGDDITEFLPKITEAIGEIKPEKLDALIDAMSEVTTVEGSGGGPLVKKFDEVFADDFSNVIMWLWFACNVNFGEFFRNALKGATSSQK